MPTQIVGDYANALQRGRHLDRTANGVLWAVIRGNSGNEFWYSTDDGATWTHDVTADFGTTGNQVTLFIDQDDYAHVLFFTGVGSELGYRRGTPDASRTSWTWGSTFVVATNWNGDPSCVAHREGTGWKIHIVFESFSGANAMVRYEQLDVSSVGVVSSAGVGTDLRNPASAGGFSTEIDFRHTGDGKTPHATPNIYAAYSQFAGTGPSQYFRKGSYSAGVWSWGTERVIDANASDRCTMAFDGTRIVIGYFRTATPTVVRMSERDEADTATTANDPTVLADGNIGGLSVMGRSNGDAHLLAVGATSGDPKTIRYNRGGAAWAGSWTTLEATTITNNRMTLHRGGSNVEAYYGRFDGALFDQMYERIAFAHEPTADLRGIGSMTADAALAIAGQATLQGVATISPTAVLGLAGSATLQGVGSMTPTPLFVPKKDFTVYDGYLDNPVSGVMPLIYFEDESARPQTTSRPLRPPRTDTGQDPTEVRPESGEIFSQQDFSHGSGQLYFHHEGRDVRRYLWSEGFELDVDTVGQPSLLRHLHDVPTAAFTSTTVGKIEVFNDSPFVIDGANIKKGSGDFPGFWLNENPGGTPQDMVSSGEHLYAALGASGIARRDVAGAWSIWQATPLATRIAWVKNRIMASDGTTTYEITDTVRTVEILPAGWVFESIFEAGGFVYAVANNASSGLSRISTYGLNQGGDAIEKKNETPFPRNQLMYAGRGFLGSVYIGGGIKNTSEGFDPVVYQAFPQDSGALTYLKVSEGEGAGAIDLSVRAFEPIGEDIIFGWSLGSGFTLGSRDGLAIHKPKVDAFIGHLKKAGAGSGKQVMGIALFRGRLLFTLKGDGLYYEDTAHLVAQAQLYTSVADWQTTSKKAWDLIQVSHSPLPAETSVRAEYSTRLPTEGVWQPGVFSDVDNSELAEARFTDVASQMISLRLTSLANVAKTQAPTAVGFLVRSNVIPDHPEFGLVRYVRLVNKDRKDHDAPKVFTDVAAVRRKIHNLAYQWVTLYEPGVIWTLHVDSVAEVQPFLVEYDATLGEGQAQAYVLQLTMTGTRD